MGKPQSFGKLERIKSKLLIDSLFDRKSLSNHSFLEYPIKTIFTSSDGAPVDDKWPQVMVSVSSKKFKRAVDRNLIKRRLKEAYRKNKIEVKTKTEIAFIYIATDILEYAKIEKAMKKSLSKLQSANKTS
jgi:ribonuclease P protein component